MKNGFIKEKFLVYSVSVAVIGSYVHRFFMITWDSWCQQKFLDYNKLLYIDDEGRIFYMDMESEGTGSGIIKNGEKFNRHFSCTTVLNTPCFQKLASLTLLFKKSGLRKQVIMDIGSFHAARWHPVFQMTARCHIGTCAECLIFAYKYLRELNNILLKWC